MYERYLANRRMSVPIQTAAGLLRDVRGTARASCSWPLRRRVPAWLSSLGAWIAIATRAARARAAARGAPAEPVVRDGGAGRDRRHPGRDRGVRAGRAARGTLEALAWMGVAVLAVFVLEAVLGWTAAMFTFLGGTELDGGRFYGLPNVEHRAAAGGVRVSSLIGCAGTGERRRADRRRRAVRRACRSRARTWGPPSRWRRRPGCGGGRGDRGARSPLRSPFIVAAKPGSAVTVALNRFLPGPATHITNSWRGRVAACCRRSRTDWGRGST